ncbi:CopD family protein, partial [uncultured Pseudoalteromonas sp.]
MSALLIYKTLHVFFMIAWFAGIFYLPRLFVY